MSSNEGNSVWVVMAAVGSILAGLAAVAALVLDPMLRPPSQESATAERLSVPIETPLEASDSGISIEPIVSETVEARTSATSNASRILPSASGFLFPDSDRRYLTASDVAALSPRDLRIARNEIFARRGRFFESPDLQAHFGRFSWYHPTQAEVTLNAVEQANVQLIQAEEARRS